MPPARKAALLCLALKRPKVRSRLRRRQTSEVDGGGCHAREVARRNRYSDHCPAVRRARRLGAHTLSGLVTSIDAAPMEGVLVSAKKQGSTITVTVVTGQDGRYSFPAGKLDPGHYLLKVRAVGYELSGPREVDVAQSSTADLTLGKTEDLAAQLSNAEWIASVP